MVKGMIIVHVPFKVGYRASGGGLRPQKMIKAFEQLGYEVLVIEGGHKQRAKVLKETWSRFKHGQIKIDFIYSESSSNPTILTDRKNWIFFKDFYYLYRFHKEQIPVFLFYRDVHWNFKLASKKHSFLKWSFLRLLHYIDILFYLSFVDTLLLPSLEMKEFIPFGEKFSLVEDLPPGHDSDSEIPLRLLDSKPRGIYVGGVLPPVYDISSLALLSDFMDVTVCCRLDEWIEVKDYYGSRFSKIKVIHSEGEELTRLLFDNHASLMIRASHEYLNFSQPLKFYEAIGFELPVLVSPGSLVSGLVEQWNIGWIYDSNKTELSFDDYHLKVENIRKIKALHTWTARAQKVIGLYTK